MDQSTRSKHSNIKNRAKFAASKSVSSSRDKFKTLDSKKKGILGINNNNFKDGEYKRRNNSVKRVEGDENRGRGFESSRSEINGSKFGLKARKWGAQDSGGDRRRKSDNINNNNASSFEDGNYKRRNDSVKRVEGDEIRGRGFKLSRSGFKGAKDNGNKFGLKTRKFDNWGARDAGGDRRRKSDYGENKNGFVKRIGDVKYEDGKRLGSFAEERKFGVKKLKKKENVADDSVAMFDRPRRKRRLIRVEYPHDTANKRFDDNLPTIDKATEQKKDSDTEDDVEMSKNAQFRAIQPSPSIVSFVNENLLGRRREIEFKRAGYNIELPSPLDNIPFSTSSERERIEESVFRNKLAFFAAAKVSSSFPPPDLPEIAFAGRSNVGKSSLLNSLTRQWGVVRTSDKPGLTQTINFFNLASKLCLVDLPGYGFAHAKDEVKESWEELVKEYVSTREGLKRVCLLIDTKWGMKPRDHELVDLMERSKTKYQIVLTKTDLSFPIDVARRAMQIEESLKTKKSAIQPLMMVSSKTGAGIRSLRTVLSNVSRFARL